MPTYEYVCRSCGHRFEVVRSIHDDALTECPDCGGQLRKVFTPPAISFKGSGFYATDHGKKRAGSTDGEKRSTKSDTGETGEKGEKKETTGKKDRGSSDGSTPASGSGTGSGPTKKATEKEGGSGS
jgi:putative FmdB family regulatory protein